MALSGDSQRSGVSLCALPLRQSSVSQGHDVRSEAGIDGGHQARSGLWRRLLPACSLLPEDRRGATRQRDFRQVRRDQEESATVALRRAPVVSIKKNNQLNAAFRWGL